MEAEMTHVENPLPKSRLRGATQASRDRVASESTRSASKSFSGDETKEKYGDLLIDDQSGERQFEGFIDFCVNVVYDAEKNEWVEFKYDKNGKKKYVEIKRVGAASADEQPDCSDKWMEHHPALKKEKVRPKLPRHLFDFNELDECLPSPPGPPPRTGGGVDAENPRDINPDDGYKSRYKMVWLSHSRVGLHGKSAASKRLSQLGKSNKNAVRKNSLSEMNTLPERRLLDRKHLLDVTMNIFATIISVLAIYEPISTLFDTTIDDIEKDQEKVKWEILKDGTGGIDYADVASRQDSALFGRFCAYLQIGFVEIFAIMAVGFIWEKTIRQIWWYSSVNHGGVLIDFANENDTWWQKHSNFSFSLCVMAFGLQAFLLASSEQNFSAKLLTLYISFGALKELYSPVEACQQTEDELISLQKFCEKDFNKASEIIRDCTMIQEVHALQRMGDISRWQVIMLARWAETNQIKWDYMYCRPFELEKLTKDEQKRYREIKEEVAYSFKMLHVDTSILPAKPELFSETTHPYNLNYPHIFGFEAYTLNIRPPNLLLRTILKSTRWSNTLDYLIFQNELDDDNYTDENDHTKKRAAFMLRYIYETLLKGKSMSNCPFDEKMKRWSNNFLRFARLFGVFLSIGVAVYCFFKVDKLANKIEKSCVSRYDCSGKVCLQVEYFDGSGMQWENMASWIGDGYCDKSGLYFCEVELENGERVSAFLNTLDACVEAPTEEKSWPLFSLECPEFDYDGGDCGKIYCGSFNDQNAFADTCELCTSGGKGAAGCGGECQWNSGGSICEPIP